MRFDSDYGVFMAHPMDPRTEGTYPAEADDLAAGIDEAISILRRADAYEDVEAARAAASEVGMMFIAPSDVPTLLRGAHSVSRAEMAAICSCMASLLGEGMTQDQRRDDPIITALDSAAMALMDGGQQ